MKKQFLAVLHCRRYPTQTVRIREGKRLVTDGPFADPESNWGLFFIEAHNLTKLLR